MTACEKYQELISAMLDGELTEIECKAVQAHIALCDRCRAMYEIFAGMDVILAETEEIPAALHENIMAGVKQAAAVKKRSGKIYYFRRAAAAAACFVVLVGAAFATRELTPGRNDISMKSAPRAPAGEDSTMEMYYTASSASYGAVAGEVGVNTTDSIAEEAKAEASPMESQAEQFDGIPMPEPGMEAEQTAWISALRSNGDEMIPVTDLAAMSDVLLPMPDAATVTETDCGAFDITLELEQANGVVRTLKICVTQSQVFVEENGTVYLANCTPAEFEAIK